MTATTAVALAVGVISKPALADPPPEPSLPSVFCFRITDIREDKTDPQGNRFTFEFETLNWTDQPAYDLDIALNVGTSNGLFFSNPGVDQNGAPLGPDPGDWGGRPLPPGSPAPSGTPNNWSVTNSTSTFIRWDNGLQPPIPNIDLIGGQRPSFLNPADPETIDDGNNVLDGFTFTVDNFDPSEILSFNWFLTKADGTPIATAATPQGNAFGFGTVNLARVDGRPNPPALFQFIGGQPFNTGFRQTPVQFYDSVNVVPDPAVFAAEFGGGGTAQFLNPDDSKTICGSNGCPVNLELVKPVPEPSSLVALGLTALGMLGYGRHRQKPAK
jgi:hypothetical protein